MRLSPAHPTVHLASTHITEANKTDQRSTRCGAGLRAASLLNVPQPVTCGLCVRKLRKRRIGLVITEEQVREAAQRQPDRYLLYSNAEGVLLGFDDRDTGVEWVAMREADGQLNGWIWFA